MADRQTYRERYDEKRRVQNAKQLADSLITETKRMGFRVVDPMQPGELAEALTITDAAYRRGYFEALYDSGVWGAKVHVSAKFTEDPTNSDHGLTAEVSLSWSSTSRSLAVAVNAVAAYQRAIELAAFIEAIV